VKGDPTCPETALPQALKVSESPGDLEKEGVSSAGDAPASECDSARATPRLRDYTGWVLDSAEATKFAAAFGPFTHTFCGPNRSDGDTLLAPELPLEQFGKVQHPTAALTVNIERENVLVVAPTRRAGLLLQHLLQVEGLTGLVIVPKQPKAKWWHLTKRTQVVHEYPPGTENLFYAPPMEEGQPTTVMPPAQCSFVVLRVTPGPRECTPRSLGVKFEAPFSATPMDAPELYTLNLSNKVICLRGKCMGTVLRVLVDSGASHDFVAAHLVTQLKLPTTQDDTVVVLGNGSRQDGSLLVPQLSYRIKSFKDTRPFRVTKLANYDIILGKPWLTMFNPAINWTNNNIKLYTRGQTHVLAPKHTREDDGAVGLLSAIQLKRLLKQGNEAYLAVLTEVQEGEGDTDCPATQHTMPELQGAVQKLMESYHKTLGPMPKHLPPRRDVDHEIELEPGTKPPFMPVYHMSPRELAEVKQQLT
jgi:hypothetical protein